MVRKRLGFFIFGTIAGCVFVYFILIKGNKFPAWLPEDRVKDQIQATRIELAPKTRCMLTCLNLPKEEISKVITGGDVIFSESETGKKPYPIYLIEGKGSNGKVLQVRTETNSVTQVTTVWQLDEKEKSQLQKCNCDSIK